MTTANLQTDARPDVNAASQKCFACHEEIVDGRWFCKIPREDKPTVVLCCPGCALRYFDTLLPAPNGDDSDRVACERSLRFLMNGEMP